MMMKATALLVFASAFEGSAFLHANKRGPAAFELSSSSSSPEPDEGEVWLDNSRLKRWQLDLFTIRNPKPKPVIPTISLIKENLVTDRKGKTDEQGVFRTDGACLSEDFKKKLVKKAICMDIRTQTTTKKDVSVGQASLKQVFSRQETFYRPVTALHNVVPDKKGQSFHEAQMYFPHFDRNQMLVPVTSDSDTTDKLLPMLGKDLEKQETWTCHDVGFGKNLDSDDFLRGDPQEVCFDWVPETFQLQAGMRVGMVVYRKFGLKWKYITQPESDKEAVGDGIGDDITDDERLIDIYGKKDQVCIYTGEIVKVSTGNGSFLHNINTYSGCSGAAIFLLGENDPLVDMSLSGYAVGVHAGGMEFSNENIGFRGQKD